MGQQAPTSVIAVTSGKGGVGKTNIAVNTAVAIAESGKSVVLFDADLGLANIDIALGLKPAYDITHVLSGALSLEEILVEGPAGVKIIPASSGVAKMASPSAQEQAGLIQSFSTLSFPVDTLIVDTGAGIDPTVMRFASACQEVAVVICDEPTSLADAYALIKVMSRDYGTQRFQIVVNMVESELQGRRLFEKLCGVSDRFLDVSLALLGIVPRDEYLLKAVRAQQAVITAYPRCPAALAFRKLAETIDRTIHAHAGNGGLGFFVEQLIESRQGNG